MQRTTLAKLIASVAFASNIAFGSMPPLPSVKLVRAMHSESSGLRQIDVRVFLTVYDSCAVIRGWSKMIESNVLKVKADFMPFSRDCRAIKEDIVLHLSLERSTQSPNEVASIIIEVGDQMVRATPLSISQYASPIGAANESIRYTIW